jgi:hypothetical protein
MSIIDSQLKIETLVLHGGPEFAPQLEQGQCPFTRQPLISSRTQSRQSIFLV